LEKLLFENLIEKEFGKMCKNGSFKIKFVNQLEKERAEKFYKKLKRKNYTVDIYLNIYPAKGKLEINYCKIFKSENMKKEIFSIKINERVERIFLNQIRTNDIAFKHLLRECRVEYYHKNKDNIRLKDKKYDTNYFMDTLILADSNNNNRTRIDIIGFENNSTIYMM